jgi:hypothetical protein
LQRQLDSRELQPTLAGRERDPPAGSLAQRHDLSVHLEPEMASYFGPLAAQHFRGREAALLEGRDLGLVEHVPHVDAVAGDADLGEVVDGQVAERVRRRHGRNGGEHREREEGDADPDSHRSSSSARSARGA